MRLLAALLVALFALGAPAHAGCVMGLDGADKAIAQYGMKKHVLDGQRLLAFVDLSRERTPQYKLEEDTTAIWLIEAPETGNPQTDVGFLIEVSDKCVTYKPEQIPLAAVKHILNEIARRVVGA